MIAGTPPDEAGCDEPTSGTTAAVRAVAGGSMTVKVWVRMQWQDQRLKWNPADCAPPRDSPVTSHPLLNSDTPPLLSHQEVEPC